MLVFFALYKLLFSSVYAYCWPSIELLMENVHKKMGNNCLLIGHWETGGYVVAKMLYSIIVYNPKVC